MPTTTFNLDFMRFRYIALAVSVTALLVSLFAVLLLGINRGLDFTGGALIEVGFDQPVEINQVRDVLAEQGFERAVVQNFGSDTDVVLRVPPREGFDQSNVGAEILTALVAEYPRAQLRRSEFVGPAVGEELTENGGLALLIALLVVMIYIMFRFTGKFAIGAVVALVHDVLIVVGIFTLLQLTFNLAELAALLAVIGYSLNDTIVVSDRIRENFRSVRRRKPIEIINISLNQTLGRTLVTSLTTTLVLVALLIAGGEQIFGFALVLTIGVLIGTYSSIFVAASTLLLLGLEGQNLAVAPKEGQDQRI